MPGPAILVVGVGNPLRGDDGVGVRLAEILAARALPDDVEVIDGGTLGLGLVNLLEGRQRVVIMDAAHLDRDPGEFAFLRLSNARLLGEERHLSVHGAGVRDALLLAEALDSLPDDVLIVGVQPASMDWDTSLTPQVQAALPRITQAILEELGLATEPTSGPVAANQWRT